MSLSPVKGVTKHAESDSTPVHALASSAFARTGVSSFNERSKFFLIIGAQILSVELLLWSAAWSMPLRTQAPSRHGLFGLAIVIGLAQVASALIALNLIKIPGTGTLVSLVTGWAVSAPPLAIILPLASSSVSARAVVIVLVVTSLFQFLTWIVVAGRKPTIGIAPACLAGLRRAVFTGNWTILDSQTIREVDVVVLDEATLKDPFWRGYVAGCGRTGIPVVLPDDARAASTGRINLDSFSPPAAPLPLKLRAYLSVRRLLELGTIVLTAPVWLSVSAIIALAIKLESPGPVIFWQERLGRDGKVFRMAKFRSMCAESEVGGPRFAAVGDCRVTRVGKFIRKVRLDELPQFWNVLRDEMSLIGPRPEQAAFARSFEAQIPTYRHRHLLAPGITGWAQVNQGYTATVDETRTKLEFDLYYLRYRSVWLDLAIVVRTLLAISCGFGAR